MIEDQELGEDLDEQQEPTEKELEELEDAGDVDDDAAPTENKWANRRSLSEMLEEEDGAADKAKPAAAKSPARTPAAPTAKSEEKAGNESDDVDDEDDDDDELEEEETPTQDKKASQEKPAEGAAKARYSVKGADGKAFEFELEEGTSIQFKADGRDVEVKTMDELVQLAQKGAAFDRKTSEQGQQIQSLTTKTSSLQEALTTTRKTSEELLMAALFDREKRAELRKALAPYRDPAYREGVEAKLELENQKAAKQEHEQTEIETKQAEFWQGVGVSIRKEIETAEHLTDADAMEVAKRFHAGYAQTFATKVAELKAAGVVEAEATKQANEHALAYFTEKNLRRVVRGLNAELADERAATPKKKVGTPRDEKAGKAEADAHNKTLTRKLEHRARTPRLQGGGASPGGSSGRAPQGAPAKPRTFEQRMNGLGKMLRNGADE